MIIVQMLVGVVGVVLCLALLYVVVRLIVRLGKFTEGESSFSDDVGYFLTGVFSLIVAVILISAFVASSYWIGEKILTVLGWIG